MKLPRNFFKPLAIGAPKPLAELPIKLERMIHFVPPHVEKLRAKLPQLEQALTASVGPHQRFLLARQLAHIDDLDALLAEVSAEIAARERPYAAAQARLDTIPGVGPRTAEVLLAEIGPDVSRFRSAQALASWAGMCPGNHESAGKRKSGRTRKGNPWLRTALVEVAQAAGRAKQTYLGAHYQPRSHLELYVQINNLLDHHYYTGAQLGPTGFTSSGAFIARPLPPINGEFPIVHATFYAPGAPIGAWGGLRVRF